MRWKIARATNNIARNGGGVQGGRYVRCLLKGNYTIADNGTKSQWSGRDGYGYGGAGETVSYSRFFNCLFDSREDRSVLVYNFCYLYNCTFTGTAYVSPQNSCFLYNCIVPGSTLLGGNTVCYYNCLLGSEPDNPKSKEGSEVVTDWSTVLDASYRPLAGGAAVDKGNNSSYQAAYPSEVDPFDYFGGQRVYSEVIDIGCAEYDARSAFGKILARSRAMVVSASAGVKASDDGNGLVVSAGETLEVEYDSIGKGETAEVRFETEISGGVLTVYLDGQLCATVSDGKQVLTFAGNQSVRRLSFSYAGTDSATIGSFRGNGGLMLIFR